MKPEEVYVSQVLSKLPAGAMQNQIAMELRSHIADRVERGHSVDEAIRQLGDPAALAESYLSAVPLVPAPHTRRALAKLVDLAIPILFVCGMAALYVLRLRPLAERGGINPWLFAYLPGAIVIGGSILYGTALMIAEFRTGQTLGKRLFDLRVVRESGARIGLGQAFVRQIPIFLQIFWIDALFTLFTDHRQRAFEMLSKTRVVVAQESHVARPLPIASPLPVAL
ncbi:MAG TPA: RDD family protein [Candidatus Eisenbacteria bacterium]|nr:RDD family protein [Candidatus Eisenbacteria bacterium]